MVTVHFTGVEELQRKLRHPSWAAGPAGKFLDMWRFTVERVAKSNAPFWRGHLRRSITSERDTSFFPTWARAGTNVVYGPWVHDGTRPHWAPLAAITPWAVSHGLEPKELQYAIAAHGTKANPFLKEAAEDAQTKIGGWLSSMASSMEAEAAA